MTAPSSLQSRLRTTALCAALSLAPALGLAQGGVMNLLNSLGGGSSGGGGGSLTSTVVTRSTTFLTAS